MGVGPFEGVWTLLGIRILLDGHGLFEVHGDPCGGMWTPLCGCGPFCGRVDPLGWAWTLLTVCGPFWGHFWLDV